MKIYTRTGDRGSTGLIGGARIEKNSLRIRAIGDVDELNASLGIARAERPAAEIDADLEWIQNRLFDIGAELAAPVQSEFKYRSVNEACTARLERSIDSQTVALSPLTNFILPGGARPAAALHFSRCVCRRAERTLLDLHDQEPVRDEVRIFINRLSDWLFVAARTCNAAANVMDVAWTKLEED